MAGAFLAGGIKGRLGPIESRMAGRYALYATLSHRLDPVVEDVQLIKRRLDLVDARRPTRGAWRAQKPGGLIRVV
jgi:hypothetical protein